MSTVELESGIRLGPGLAGILMSPDEFDAIEDYDGEFRYELIHGVLVVSPLPLESEVDPNEELGHMLRNYRDEHPKGSALDKTLPERYIRTATSRRRADRVIWAGLGRTPDPKLDTVTIAVEFVSRAKSDRRRDYVEKRKEYQEIGVAEYWIIDRFRRAMTVFVNGPTGFEEKTIQAHETYRTPLLPGFELPLARLLDVADEWKATPDSE